MGLREHIQTQLERGPQSRAELQAGTGVSQATLSRTLRDMPLRRFGAARSTRYVLPRPVRDLEADIPVYRVSRLGKIQTMGTLTPAYGGNLTDLEGEREWHEGLPWFIADMLPQGFLGRRFARAYPELGLPERLSDWSNDHGLYAIACRGEDLPGNLILGEAAMRRWYAQGGEANAWVATGADRLDHYRRMAERVLAGEVCGSSAAGERPKFTAHAGEGEQTKHYLVKFSPPVDQPAGRRWSDLLICEHLAARTLNAAKLPAAATRIRQNGERTYLEVERFDRVGAHGRVGLVTIGALDDAFLGHRRSWPDTAAALGKNRVAGDDFDRIVRIYAFGQWIANTDMHFGNLAFRHEGNFPLRLAPVYDMLPMRYAPQGDEVVEVDPTAPRPGRRSQPVWEEVRALAARFWAAAANDTRISQPFRAIARRWLDRLAS